MNEQTWLPLFLRWAKYLKIDSKERGVVALTDCLYGSQVRFLEQVCDGLDRGIRDFKNLKARQLGISTISLAIDLFWLSVHDAIQGALVVDTESNKEKFRILLTRYIESLPKSLRIGVHKENRNGLVLDNGSTLDYLVAGTRQKSNAGLGRSRALNFIHATEVSSWGNYEDVASLVASMAQLHPDRLYIWESTAKGYNLFYDMWTSAKEDIHTQKSFFCGWWSREDYAFPRGSREYKHYWNGAFDDAELDLIKEVRKRYGVTVRPEQVVWHRHMRTVKITDEDRLNAEFPWTEDQAFVLTGKSFFPLRRVSEDLKTVHEQGVPFLGYRYYLGENFTATQIEQVQRADEAELRIWEEPHPNGIYVMGVDPAYGRSDNKDRHAIEVYRCYADKIVQVAEYATDEPETYQVSWVMCHLAGAYKNIWINLEVSGPGFAIMQELRHLKQLVQSGYLNSAAHAAGMLGLFDSVRWYLWHKPDQLGAGYVYGWKTNMDNKILIMNQLRDNYSLQQILIRSTALLNEMQTVIQSGAEIAADGRGKDDRVFASALAVKAWIDWVRMGMIANNQTYDEVVRQETIEADQPHATFMGHVIGNFFKQKEAERAAVDEARAWAGVDWE